MDDLADLLTKLERLDWLHRVGEPDARASVVGTLEEVAAMLADRPEAFFAPPYASPYEGLCVADHEAASALDSGRPSPRAQALATAAYLSAWEKIPVPEVCGLISDDALTLATLLLCGRELSLFTSERLNWYLRGRAPWGYEGDFPEGRWIVL